MHAAPFPIWLFLFTKELEGGYVTFVPSTHKRMPMLRGNDNINKPCARTQLTLF